MDIETASDWLKAIKEKYIHGGDESYDEQRKEAIDFAIKTMNDQQHTIWELQDLVEYHEDTRKKIRLLVDSKGEIHPLETVKAEPVEPIPDYTIIRNQTVWRCGNCSEVIGRDRNFVNFCWNCGVAVKHENG